MNFKGTIQAKRDIQCNFCGRIVGPKRPIKMMYVQYGAGGGNFCTNTCAKNAYDAVTEKHPELKTQEDSVFKGVTNA